MVVLFDIDGCDIYDICTIDSDIDCNDSTSNKKKHGDVTLTESWSHMCH